MFLKKRRQQQFEHYVAEERRLRFQLARAIANEHCTDEAKERSLKLIDETEKKLRGES
ncbi:MAG: hypothetical protein ACRDHW_04015 [Ktedonobacteraceae bacterium]